MQVLEKEKEDSAKQRMKEEKRQNDLKENVLYNQNMVERKRLEKEKVSAAPFCLFVCPHDA